MFQTELYAFKQSIRFSSKILNFSIEVLDIFEYI